jgi:hypothetical protein
VSPDRPPGPTAGQAPTKPPSVARTLWSGSLTPRGLAGAAVVSSVFLVVGAVDANWLDTMIGAAALEVTGVLCLVAAVQAGLRRRRR